MTAPPPDSPRDPSGDLDARLARIEAALDAPQSDAGLQKALPRLLRLLPLVAAANAVLAVPALIISVGVAYFAFVQAEATDKMQVASVWPRVTYVTSNQDEDGTRRITLSLINKGVGPAVIRGMELRYRGKAYTGFRELLDACCAQPGDMSAIGIGSINGEVLRPGEEMMFALLEPEGTDAETYDRFNIERRELQIGVCYCSVFDDCWVEDWKRSEPRPVAQCPADWVQYSGFPREDPVFPEGDRTRR